MNRFLIASIEVSAAATFALIVVGVTVPKNSLIPGIDVSPEQIIYSLARASGTPVRTGYKLNVGDRVPGSFSPPPSASPLAVAGASSSGERPTKEPRRPPAAGNSRTTVEQLRPEKISPSEELLNPYIIENLVKASDKTYYFTEKSLTRSGVTVELLSMTPRKDDYFLKFRITNASKDYFIPQAFAVKHGDDWVDLETFFKHMLLDGESQVGYLRVKVSASVGAGKDKMFQLNESGKGFRKYSIFY